MLPVFEKTIAQVKEQCGFAGGAFIAIKDGEVVVKETFGVADIETGRPITEDTIFDIASDSKCMTTSIISQLCDEGKLDWDAPVRKYYPEFFLENEVISEMMTLKDLASHRSGICSQNFPRRAPVESVGSRAEFIRRMKYLKMSKPFRDSFQYQNEYFALLGYVAELVTGQTWEELVTERIAKRFDMDILFRGQKDPEDMDIAMPYSSEGTGVEPMARNIFGFNNPCGGARTNLKSAERWLRMWMSGGMAPDGERFISQEMFTKMTTPISFWRDPKRVTSPDHFRCYGLGLAPSVFRGRKLVYHGGSINGFRSAMGFFPELNSGYFIMINSNCMPLAVLKVLLCDAALGILQDDYTDLTDIYIKDWFKPSTMPSKLTPELEISAEEKAKCYGVWENGFYGRITVSDGGENKLHFKFFKTEWDLPLRNVLPDGTLAF